MLVMILVINKYDPEQLDICSYCVPFFWYHSFLNHWGMCELEEQELQPRKSFSEISCAKEPIGLRGAPHEGSDLSSCDWLSICTVPAPRSTGAQTPFPPSDTCCRREELVIWVVALTDLKLCLNIIYNCSLRLWSQMHPSKLIWWTRINTQHDSELQGRKLVQPKRVCVCVCECDSICMCVHMRRKDDYVNLSAKQTNRVFCSEEEVCSPHC